MAEKKISKEAANYRMGTPYKECSKCSMYRPPHDCTLVKGGIKPYGVCDYYKKK